MTIKLQTKKIIAREFLVLTFCIVLGVGCFLCTYFYNFYRRNQINNLNTEIQLKQNLADSLSVVYNLKNKNQKWYFDKMSDEYDLGKFNINQWWDRSEHYAKTDSIALWWKKNPSDFALFFNKIGFNTPDSLQNFIVTNSINDIDIKNNQTSAKTKQDIKYLSSKREENQQQILSYNEQESLGYKSLYIFIFIFCIVRYIYYAIRWSFKTLKENK